MIAVVSSALYLAPCPLKNDGSIAALAKHLHPDVIARLSGYRQAERRNQTILGRALLAFALAEVGVGEVRISHLGTTPSGAPAIPSGYTASISHCADFVGAIACKGGAVGLDLENRSPQPNLPHFVDWRCDHGPGPCDCFVRGWAAREAVAKASGSPLEGLLQTPFQEDYVDLAHRWYISTHEISDDTLACIASNRDSLRPQVVMLKLRTLFEKLHCSDCFQS